MSKEREWLAAGLIWLASWTTLLAGALFCFILNFRILLLFFWLWIAAVGYGLGHALVGRRLAACLAPELVLTTGLVGLSWGLAVLSFGLGIGPGVQIGVSAWAGLYCGWRWWQAPVAARTRWVSRLLAPLRGPGRLAVAALLLVFGALVLVHAGQPPIFRIRRFTMLKRCSGRSATRLCRAWEICTGGWHLTRICIC